MHSVRLWLTIWYASLYQTLFGNYPEGTPMTDGGKQKLDLNDAFISPLFVISAAVDADLVDLTMFGFDFSAALMEFSSGSDASAVSTATIISVVTLMIAFATNRPDFEVMGFVQTWVAIATIALVLSPPFIPILGSILSITIFSVIAVVIQAAGFYTLAYLG